VYHHSSACVLSVCLYICISIYLSACFCLSAYFTYFSVSQSLRPPCGAYLQRHKNILRIQYILAFQSACNAFANSGPSCLLYSNVLIAHIPKYVFRNGGLKIGRVLREARRDVMIKAQRRNTSHCHPVVCMTSDALSFFFIHTAIAGPESR